MLAIPLVILLAIATVILFNATTYATGFVRGRIRREFGVITVSKLVMMAVMWAGIFGLYVALGMAV